MNAQQHDVCVKDDANEAVAAPQRRVSPDYSLYSGLHEAGGGWTPLVARLCRRPTRDIIILASVAALYSLARNMPSEPSTPTAGVVGVVAIAAMIAVIALCALFKKEDQHGTACEESADPPP